MSAWVHVAAIARIDFLPILDNGEEMDFDTAFGKECLWGADKSVWYDAQYNKDDYLPMGSEGSLRKTVWVNPCKNHADRYTVSIFGDLRNVADGQWIIDWFKKKLSKMYVRQATITVDAEYAGITTWTFDRESGDVEPPDFEEDEQE